MVREGCGVLSMMARYNDGVLQMMALYEFGVLQMKACPLPSLVRRLETDPDPACVLTMRAADKWDAARFRSISLALSFSDISGRIQSHPLAANAGRWAHIS